MRKRPWLSPKTLFRHWVVSEVRARVLMGKPLAQAVAEVTVLPHVDARGQARAVRRRTVYRWLKRHGDGGVEALEDKPRPVLEASAVLGEKLLAFLRQEKTTDRDASVPELIRRARVRGLLGAEQALDRTSVWRACRRMGLPLTRVRTLAQTDMRRYAYPNRMLMVLCDGKHFRAGVARLRRVALVFLDDATRYGLDVVVGTAEQTVLFLRGLHLVIARFGRMVALFLDRGPGFISDDTHGTCARLAIAFIHGTAGYPEGHGKIEKFNQTCWQQLLRGFDGNPEIDPDLGALRARLLHFLHTIYNKAPHAGLDGDTPEQRWNADARALEYPKDRRWLEGCFVSTFQGTVSKDNVISFRGVDYEVLRGHAGTKITVYRHLLREGLFLSVLHEERLMAIHPVDLTANAYARRARPENEQPIEPTPIVHTAASLAYQAEFAPIVGADGGFSRGDDER